MRKTIPRKRSLVRAGNEAADRLVALVGYCEFCGRDNVPLCQHEIAGGALRLKARLEPWACLCLCSECHTQLHRMPKPEQTLLGLAILYHSRTSDLDLKAFNNLYSPTAPNRFTWYDVNLWVARLTH